MSKREIEPQPATPTTIELLDAMREALGGVSDYRVAIELGVTRATVSSWRNGKTHISEELTRKVAEILKLPPGYVLCAAAVERAKSSEVAESYRGLARSVLIGQKLIDRVRRRAMPVIAATAIGLAASTTPQAARASTSVDGGGVYILSNRRRKAIPVDVDRRLRRRRARRALAA